MQNKNKGDTKNKILLLASFLFCFAGIFLANSASAGTISLSPGSSTIGQDSNLSLDVNITDANNLFGIGFDLTFNSSLISFVNAVEGNFISNPSCDTAFLVTENPSGTLVVGLSFLGTSCGGVSGSGNLMTLNFRSAQLPGSGTFSFSNTAICDLSGSSCNFVDGTWRSASVNIGGEAPEDTTPPTGSISINSDSQITNVDIVNLSISASDISGVSQMKISNVDDINSVAAIAYATTQEGILSDGDGVKTVYIWFCDGIGNWSDSFSDTINLDTAGPTFSNITETNISQTQATINYTTNENSTTQIEYGVTTNYGSLTTEITGLVSNHIQTITSLIANTTYHYKVISIDNANNISESNDGTFITLEGNVVEPKDPVITPPSVPTITTISPASSSIGSTITIHGTNFTTTKGSVRFGAIRAYIVSWDVTKIRAEVPVYLKVGDKVLITVKAGVQMSNGVNFTVSDATPEDPEEVVEEENDNEDTDGDPTINSISKTSGKIGSEVILYGSNFGSTQGTIYFSVMRAYITYWSDSLIRAQVPSLLIGQQYQIKVKSGIKISNGIQFTVIQEGEKFYPDGVLIKAKGDPTVWYIEDGKRKGIPSEKVFERRFNWSQIVEVENKSAIEEYPVGESVKFSDGTVLLVENTVYVVENGKKRGMTNPEAFLNLGYKWENVIRIEAQEIENYEEGNLIEYAGTHASGTVVNIGDANNTIFKIISGQRRGIPTPAVYISNKFTWGDIVMATDADKQLPIGPNLSFPSGTIVKGTNRTVYIISGGQKRAFTSAHSFLSRGFKWENIIPATDEEIETVGDGEVIN